MPAKGSAIIGKPVHNNIPAPAGGVDMVTFIPWTLIKRGVKREIITPLSTPKQFHAEEMNAKQKGSGLADSALLRALGLAYHWQRLLDMGKVRSTAELAEREGISRQRVSLILGLVQLSPHIVESIMYGTVPKRITLDYFKKNAVPMSWDAQKTMVMAPE